MKKSLLTMICLAFMGVSLFAQKLPKSVKAAKKALNAGKADESLNLINTALEDETVASFAEAWAVKGAALASKVEMDRDGLIKSRIPGAAPYKVQYVQEGLDAYEAYRTAMSKASGNSDKGAKAAIKGLVNLATGLNETGYTLYNNERYEEAYKTLNTMLGIRETLLAAGNKNVLGKEEDFRMVQYHTGVAANAAGMPEKAMPLYEELVEVEFNQSLPYEQLFTKMVDTDEDAAFAILEKGRKACADDPANLKGFLYKEINYFLGKGQLDKLEGRLQDAIAQDPENHTLHNVLGSVYSDFAQKAFESGKVEEGDKHLAEARKYYEEVVKLKPDFSGANTSIGLLYFNKGVTYTKQLQAIEEDGYSKENDAKYEKVKAEQKALFMESKPFFEKAVESNPKDTVAIQGLKGIAAYSNDMEALEKYSKMLEAAESGN